MARISAEVERMPKKSTDGRTNYPEVGTEAIRDRAYRCCPIGSAACGFSGVEIRARETGTIADVVADCSLASCGMTPERLQEGLDQLSLQHIANLERPSVK